MDFRKLAAGAVGALVLAYAGAADAALVLAGSWDLNGGPADATAATAQQIAAQKFGGNPADYSISIAGPNPAAITFSAWAAWLGFEDTVSQVAQDASDDFGFPVSPYQFQSALVGHPPYINYAFREATVGGPGIPEPATWALMIGGFGLTGAALRRRRALTA